ncbi:recombinase family protein [Methylotuvimicrobium sp.]|uniref:recombinase family protein n=2 Tax=Methylotuvimicrobium sp. TaxID=2822413 RepID=UPI003D64DC32
MVFALHLIKKPAYCVRKTLSNYKCVLKLDKKGFSYMLVGYMRVSSDNDRQSTDLQRDALISAGVDPRHLFEDKASGARDDRVGLKQALDYVRAGDCLVVWKLDRLGRSLPHLLKIVTDLQKKKIAFRSLTEQMDTATPHGEFLFSVFGALAQYERALAKERILAGLASAKKRGRHGGRPKIISDEKLKAITDALNSGASKASVCRTFGIKRTTLYDALKRASFSG